MITAFKVKTVKDFVDDYCGARCRHHIGDGAIDQFWDEDFEVYKESRYQKLAYSAILSVNILN